MTELEQRIKETIDALAPKGKTASMLSGLKDTLKSSSQIVEAVNTIGDNLQENIEDGVGGVTGAIGGWVAGKTTKFVGGVAGGVISGTIKTVAGIIPDSSDVKLPEADNRVAHCIETYVLPSDRYALFELLQFAWSNIQSKHSPYGKQTIEAFKSLHEIVHKAFIIAAKDDKELQLQAKPYLPKKRFSFI